MSRLLKDYNSLHTFIYDKVNRAFDSRDQDEKIEAKRKALDDHLARVIRDPSELSYAGELVNSLIGAYTTGNGAEDDIEAAERRGEKRDMGLDARPASEGALAKLFNEHPAPRRV
jgi:hypothetical protein